jgi:hypothetical protein
VSSLASAATESAATDATSKAAITSEFLRMMPPNK